MKTKTLEQILNEDFKITPDTKHHNYDYIYKSFLKAGEKYASQLPASVTDEEIIEWVENMWGSIDGDKNKDTNVITAKWMRDNFSAPKESGGIPSDKEINDMADLMSLNEEERRVCWEYIKNLRKSQSNQANT